MAFALVGERITQTGSDLDLSGLAGITGVIVTTQGLQRIYNVGTLELRIQGTLDHDPDTEIFLSAHNGTTPCIDVRAGGVYNYGTIDSGNGNARRSGATGIILTGVDTSDRAVFSLREYGGVNVVGGGEINFEGGTVISGRGIGFQSTVNAPATGGIVPIVNIVGTRFIKLGTDLLREFRFEGLDIPQGRIENVAIDGFDISHRALPAIFSAEIINGRLVQLARGPELVTIREFNTSENINRFADVGCDSRDVVRVYDIINASEGSGTRMMPKGFTDRQLGIMNIFKDVEYQFTDPAGNPIQDVAVFIRDTDNGFRKNSNGVDNTPDRTYTGLSAANGILALQVLTAITNIDQNNITTLDVNDSTGVWDSTEHNNAYKVDRRGLDDTQDDRFTSDFWAYDFLPSRTTQSLKGLGSRAVPWVLFADPSVTTPLEDIADLDTLFTVNHATRLISVSINSTFDDLYDFLKHNKTLAANREFPTASTTVATANGRILQIGNYSLEVQAGVTFSAGEKFNSIQSDGLIQIDGDGEITGGVVDSTGLIITVTVNVPSARIFMQIVSNGITTELNDVTNDMGRFSTKVPEDATVTMTTKAPGYNFAKRTLDITAAQQFSIDLTLDPFVDIGLDVSLFRLTESEADVNVNEAIYPAYTAGTGVFSLVFGNINLSGALEISKRLFDELLSGEVGIEFLHKYIPPNDIASVLDGQPYSLSQNRVIMDEERITFLRRPGINPIFRAHFGLATIIRDGAGVYEAPVDSNGQFVLIDNASVVNLITPSEAVEVARQIINSGEILPAIGTAASDAVDRDIGPTIRNADHGVNELLARFGNNIDLRLIPGQSRPNQHGPLSATQNFSAIHYLYETDLVFEAGTTQFHFAWESVMSTFGNPDFLIEVYALTDVNAVDFDEPGETTKLEAFRAANVANRIFQQTEEDFDPGQHNITITVPYNRILLLARNNRPDTDTVTFRFGGVGLSLTEALQQLVEQSTEVVNFTERTLEQEDVGLDFESTRGFLDGFSPALAEAISGNDTPSTAAYVAWRTRRGGEDIRINDEEEAEITVNVGQILNGTVPPVGQNFRFHVYALPPGVSAPTTAFNFAQAQAFEIQHEQYRIIESTNVQNPGELSGTVTYDWDKLMVWFRNQGEQLNITIRDVMVRISGIIPRTLSNSYDIRLQTDRVRFNNNDEVIAAGTGSGGGTIDTSGIDELNTKLTNQRAGNLDNLDATISSRLPTSGYTAPDNAGITTLLNRLTAARAALLDNLDATISGLVASIEAGLLDDADGQAFLDAIKTQVGDALSDDNITAGAIAAAVWRVSISSLTNSGEIGHFIGEQFSALTETQSRIESSLGNILSSLISQTDVDTILADVRLCRQILNNNYLVNNNVFTIFADDGSTVLEVFDLTDTQRTRR